MTDLPLLVAARDALKPIAEIEIPLDAHDGLRIATSRFSNDHVTAQTVRRARAVLARIEAALAENNK